MKKLQQITTLLTALFSLAQMLHAQSAAELDGCRKYAEVCWLGTHNSFCNAASGYTVGPNQLTSVVAQLDNNVRCINLDVWQRNKFDYGPMNLDPNGLYLFHNPALSLAPGIQVPVVANNNYEDHRVYKTVNDIGNWLLAHPDEIVTIVIENHSDYDQNVMEYNLVDPEVMALAYTDWSSLHTVTLGEMRASGKRLLFMKNNLPITIPIASPSFILKIEQIENHAVSTDYRNTNNCDPNIETNIPLNTPGKMLFMSHHQGIGSQAAAAADNPQIVQRWNNLCAPDVPLPGFVSVDFSEVGAPIDAVREFNRRWYEKTDASTVPLRYALQLFNDRYVSVSADEAGQNLRLGTPAKYWRLEPELGDDKKTYYLHSGVGDLVAEPDAPLNGGKIKLRHGSGSNRQRWYLEPAGNGEYRLRNKELSSYCLTAPNSNLHAELYISTYSGLNSQKFSLTEGDNLRCKAVNVYPDATGTVAISNPEDLLDLTQSNLGFGPDCDAMLSATPAQLSCNVPSQTVTVTLSRAYPVLTTSCQATVHIVDTVPPALTCKNITVYLNEVGTAAVSTGQVLVTAADNCSLFPFFESTPNDFTCAHFGPNTVTVYGVDLSGNQGSCTATVTVADNIAPQIFCQNQTVYLDAGGHATVSAAALITNVIENCPYIIGGPVPSTFSCANIGLNTVSISVDDKHGNVRYCTPQIMVVDTIRPTVICKNVLLDLDANGTAALNGAAVTQNISDNCTTTHSISTSVFNCAQIGANMVTLSVSDAQGNTATCTAVVTVRDVAQPTIVCPANQTVSADADCSVPVGSYAPVTWSDNCTAAAAIVVTQNPASFTLLSGHNDLETITLTADDGHGNTRSCSFTVTLKDVAPPAVTCKNAVVYLDANGSASMNSSEVFQSGADNCGSVNQISLAPNTFTCSNYGTNTVVLTVSDGNGNTATCNATVLV